MSPKLPRRTAVEVRKAIEKKEFRLVRQSGSHQVFRNDAGVRITLPAPKKSLSARRSSMKNEVMNSGR